MARRQVLEALNHQREAFVDQHSQLPGAGELYDLTSVMNWKMPPRNDWSYYTYYVSYGTLFGMIISQLNWCLETSGRVAARLAAIDYVRHYAASYGIRFD